MTDPDVHSMRSSHREALLEHLFAGEVDTPLATGRLAGDDGGYDLVLEAKRHRPARAAQGVIPRFVRRVKVNTFLADKPSGCVVFMWFDKRTLELGPFSFFGAAPRRKLLDLSGMKVAVTPRLTRRGARANDQEYVSFRCRKFDGVDDVDALVTKLSAS